MSEQERTPEEIAIGIVDNHRQWEAMLHSTGPWNPLPGATTKDVWSALTTRIAAAIRHERTVKESLIVERDELKADVAQVLNGYQLEAARTVHSQACSPLHCVCSVDKIKALMAKCQQQRPQPSKKPSAPEPANPSEAREKSIHEVIQGCTTMTSFYRTVSNFSIALIAERSDRDKWKERAEKAKTELDAERELRIMQLAGISTATLQNTESSIVNRIDSDNPYYSTAYGDVCRAIDREMELREELRITREQRDAAVKKQAATQERYNFAKSMSASVWKTHEDQFRELEAERDRLKAVVSAIVQRFAHLTITGPFVTNYEIRDYFRNELAAARDALKGPNQ